MTFGRFARALGLCSVVVVGAALMIASGTDNNPASMTPTNPTVKVESLDQQNPGAVTVAAHLPLHFAALPLKSMQNGLQVSFNAPSPTTLKVTLIDPSGGASGPLPVITAAESPPSSTPTTGFARTDGFDTTQTPLLWMVTVRPPDPFYAFDSFAVSISVVSLNPSFTGAEQEAPPLLLFMESFRITVTSSGGTGSGVTSMPSGIACGRGGDCIHDFPPAAGSAVTNVTLLPQIRSADQQTCFAFLGWSGDCSGTDVCHVALGGTKSVNASATFDGGQPCNPGPAICRTPGRATPLCPATSANPGGIASCVNDNGWFCCSSASPSDPTSGCPSGTGPAYGAVQCPVGQGTPSASGCQ
jgi:hypothetical protein